MYFKQLATAVLLTSASLVAQEQTLLSGGLTHGGFGSWGGQVSQVNGEAAYLSSSQLVWLINHRYTVGIGSYNLIASVDGPLTFDDDGRYINMDLGGVTLGYIFAPNNLIHGSFGVLAGLGQVSYHNSDLEEPWHSEEDLIFSIVPRVDLMINMTSFIRMGINASYRLVNGVNTDGLTNANLSAPTVGAVIQFGKF